MFKCSVNEIYNVFAKIANGQKLYVPQITRTATPFTPNGQRALN